MPQDPSFEASLTEAHTPEFFQTLVCKRESCRKAYTHCSPQEKEAWKKVKLSRNTSVDPWAWVCGPCYDHYHNKSQFTQRRENRDSGSVYPALSQASSKTLDNTAIRQDIAAGQRGKGRTLVKPVSSDAIPGSNSNSSQCQLPQVSATGSTYIHPHSGNPSPSRRTGISTGYNRSHLSFPEQENRWRQKASTASKDLDELVSLKVMVGRVVVSGTKTKIVPIPSCVEGLTGVDAHIGAKDLHKLCYDVVAPLWDKWSYGYNIPQEHTKLRATGKFAELTVARDAIWAHFLKKRGGSKISQFDPSRELDIYITIGDEDYENGDFRRTTKRGEELEDEVCHKRPKRNDRKDTSGGVSMSELFSDSTRSERHDIQSPSSHNTTRCVSTSTVQRQSNLRSSNTERSVSTPTVGMPGRATADTGNAGEKSKKRRRALETLPPPSSDSDESDHGPPPSKRVIPSRAFVSPDRNSFAAALQDQRGASVRESAPLINRVSLPCTFYEVPFRAFNYSNIREDRSFNTEDLPAHSGSLIFDTSLTSASTGAFKTSHVGSVALDNGASLPPFTGREVQVCVKQLYYRKQNGGAIGRYDGTYALTLLLDECRCLDWGASLLQLTYDFIDRELKVLGTPDFVIPELRFVRALLAYCSRDKKAFLVEEWIDTSESSFVKYINNRIPESCLPAGAPPETHEIAQFLCFAQHVQWSKTWYQVFTSDYQGAKNLLTDPQILTSRKFGRIFAAGNVHRGFADFRVYHSCTDNKYCNYFKLSLDDDIKKADLSSQNDVENDEDDIEDPNTHGQGDEE